MACWSCGKERAASDSLCPHCGKVQPPPALGPGAPPLDKFAVLGLARAFDLHPSQLEERFKAAQRKLHPDRFARAEAKERRYSLEQTTLLNDAFRTLKDPVRRAEHLLELRGVRLDGEVGGDQPGRGKVEMSPEFLEEAMEDRERLLEAKVGGGPEAVQKLAQVVAQKRDATMTRVANLLRALEQVPAGVAPTLGPVAEQLARLRYYARYLDEVEGRPAEV